MGGSADGPEDAAAVTDTARLRAVGQAAVIKTRANFAGQHLLAAAKFARMSGDIETNNVGGSSADPFFQDITAYVTATLLTSAAALEAYINELFIDGNVVPVHEIGGQSEELWDIWWSAVERRNIWDKYDLALGLRKQDRFSRDKQSPLYPVYLSADLLILIRNALMHFKPQWSDEERSHHDITNRLVNEQVSPSPFGSSAPLFPHDFMSHDMARWAVKTSWSLIEAFSKRAGLPNQYAHLVSQLNPGYPTWPVPKEID